jgi:hypothetical protein
MTTAGHCGNLGDNVTNNSDSIGTIVVRHLDQNGLDLAFVHGSTYSPFAYTGPPDSANGLPISGTRLPAVGLDVCNDGATTGEDCGGRIAVANACVRFIDGITRCQVARADSTDGTTLGALGDSGGPIIRYDGALFVSGMSLGQSQYRSSCTGSTLLSRPVGGSRSANDQAHDGHPDRPPGPGGRIPPRIYTTQPVPSRAIATRATRCAIRGVHYGGRRVVVRRRSVGPWDWACGFGSWVRSRSGRRTGR